MSKTSTKKRYPSAPRGVPATADPLHVGELSRLSQERLVRLLTLRPDLAEPAPDDMEALEVRALSLPSVYLAFTKADVLVLQLAQIFTLIGDHHVALADVRQMVGDVPEIDIERGLAWLEDRHLISRLPDSGLCVHGGLLTIRGAAALGPPAAPLVAALTTADLTSILKTIERPSRRTRKAELVEDVLTQVTDQQFVRDLVRRAPAAVRDYTHEVATGSASIQLPWTGSTDTYRARSGAGRAAPSSWLVEHGLAYKDGWYTAVMPREVGLALRGGRPFPAASYQRPHITVGPIPGPLAPSAAPGQVAKVIEAVERLIDAWGSKPAALLKNQGVGVREVRRLAGAIDLPERDAFVVIEVAAAAGLIVSDTRRGQVVPTPAADEWADLNAADRWWALALSWLETPMYPSLAGTPETGYGSNKVIPALGYPPNYESEAAGQRRGILNAVLGLPSGSGATPDALAELVVWDSPLLWNQVPGNPSLMVRWTLEEMELLGLSVGGAPSPLAAALLAGDVQPARNLLDDEGATDWELILQTDLTALIAGRAPISVRAEFELLADVEGRGSATLYRFSAASLRRAFDAGRSGEQVLDFLASHAPKGVPQPLTYLVGDVERRYGEVRIGRAGCYVRFDDPALAVEVVRNKKAAKLGLRLIAPTVLLCDQTNETVLQTLRAAGYLPLVESKDGSAVHSAVARHRAELPSAPGPGSRRNGTRADQGSGSTVGWRSRLASDGTADRADAEMRSLAAALARTTRDVPAASVARHQAPGRGVEIPTLLRRPGREGPADVELSAGLLAELAGEFDGDEIDFIDRLLEAERFSKVDTGDIDDIDDLDDLDDLDDAPERPSDIYRISEEILQVLQQADNEGWLVRLSYTSAAGKSSEVTVMVLSVSDSAMVGQAAPRWTDQKYLINRISWVRVLTEAEEDVAW